MAVFSDQATCFSCGSKLVFAAGTVIGRSEECPSCRNDVRVCFNCRHYDAQSYNECQEPMAERVVNKDRRNFCDYFFLGAPASATDAAAKKAEALKKLDDLFKK